MGKALERCPAVAVFAACHALVAIHQERVDAQSTETGTIDHVRHPPQLLLDALSSTRSTQRSDCPCSKPTRLRRAIAGLEAHGRGNGSQLRSIKAVLKAVGRQDFVGRCLVCQNTVTKRGLTGWLGRRHAQMVRWCERIDTAA